jgi:septal ring factor EnvC (AmiA/AmiB activator)
LYQRRFIAALFVFRETRAVEKDFSTTTERRLPKFDAPSVWKILRWVVVATFVASSAYFGIVTKLKAAEERIDATQRDLARLQEFAKSKESAAADRELILNKLDEMDKRYTEALKSIDQRLNRIENRRR